MKIYSAYHNSGETSLSLWAPFQNKVILKIVSFEKRSIKMILDICPGCWHLYLEDINFNSLYYFQIDNRKTFPDPVSHYKPT